MTEIRKKIGDRIIELRNKKGLTQDELAELSGVSRRTIQGIEWGDFSARVDILDKLVKALGHTIEIEPYVSPITDEQIEQTLKAIKDNTRNLNNNKP